MQKLNKRKTKFYNLKSLKIMEILEILGTQYHLLKAKKITIQTIKKIIVKLLFLIVITKNKVKY